MKDINWDVYDDDLMRKDIIENYFDDTTESKCKSKFKCGNNVTIDTFDILISKGKSKLICLECKSKY
jgi:hypothetical protein